MGAQFQEVNLFEVCLFYFLLRMLRSIFWIVFSLNCGLPSPKSRSIFILLPLQAQQLEESLYLRVLNVLRITVDRNLFSIV